MTALAWVTFVLWTLSRISENKISFSFCGSLCSKYVTLKRTLRFLLRRIPYELSSSGLSHVPQFLVLARSVP